MSDLFSQHPFYFLLAVVGTILYILKMLMFFIGGDSDADIEASDIDGGDNFSIISIQSILAFMMGTGWIGLAAKTDWKMTDGVAMACAAGFGVLMMLFSAFITFKIKGLNSIPKVNYKDIEGAIGRAYTNIPAEGSGQVEIVVNGSQRVLPARSHDGEINAFDSVVIVSSDESGNLVVKKA